MTHTQAATVVATHDTGDSLIGMAYCNDVHLASVQVWNVNGNTCNNSCNGATDLDTEAPFFLADF